MPSHLSPKQSLRDRQAYVVPVSLQSSTEATVCAGIPLHSARRSSTASGSRMGVPASLCRDCHSRVRLAALGTGSACPSLPRQRNTLPGERAHRFLSSRQGAHRQRLQCVARAAKVSACTSWCSVCCRSLPLFSITEVTWYWALLAGSSELAGLPWSPV